MREIDKLRKVSATEARVHFGALSKSIVAGEGAVLIERYGKPVAVMMAYDEYRRLSARSNLLDYRNQSKSEVEEVAAVEEGAAQ
jgi:prevent-host-death family protein